MRSHTLNSILLWQMWSLYRTTLTMDFQIVLSSILHFRNNFIHNHAIQNPTLHSQFVSFMSQSISTRYTLPGNPFENILIGQILATKAIFLRISESRAKLRLLSFFYSMSKLFAFSSHFLCSSTKLSYSFIDFFTGKMRLFLKLTFLHNCNIWRIHNKKHGLKFHHMSWVNNLQRVSSWV